MESNFTQQEILLITGTSFASRQWCEKDGLADKKMLTEKERLEEACWYGLVKKCCPNYFVQKIKKLKYFSGRSVKENLFLN